MKYVLSFLVLLCLQAKADDGPLIVWLVAPEIWSADTPELKTSLHNLESYLLQSLGRPVQVELKTSPGFALSQYFFLQERLKTSQPDYIFYVQPSRMFARDFEEVLFSRNLPDTPLTAEVFSKDEIFTNQPTWSRVLLPRLDYLLPVKKAIFIQDRLETSWNVEGSATDKREFFLDVSFVPLRSIQFLLKDKARVVFLISPERIRYNREIFPDNQMSSSVAQIFFSGANVDKKEIKEYLAYSGFNFQLLTREFYQLFRSENLMGGSRTQLNSNGVNKSFQIIKPMISSYLAMEKNRKENAEKMKAETKKPKTMHKKQKAKATI